MSTGKLRYHIDADHGDRCMTDDGCWAPRPRPGCGCCRGTGYGWDDDGDRYRCDCEHPTDAEARDHVADEAIEVLTIGYRTLGFTMPAIMAEREAQEQLEAGCLDDAIMARVELLEDRERMKRLDRKGAA